LTEPRPGSEKLSSTARYVDYLMRAAIFVLLIGFGVLASRLARRSKGRP